MVLIDHGNDDDNDNNDDDNEWRGWWKSNGVMGQAFISLVLVINRKDFEQAYTVSH